VEGDLCRRKTVIIEFNPWYSQSKERIMTDFLKELSNVLSKVDLCIAHEIDRYLTVLGQSNTGFLSTIASFFVNSNKDLIKTHFDRVNKSITELGILVFVFIDDIDRLMADEILNVFQLVRNTANFRNTIFILAYDSNYVVQTMEDSDFVNPQDYVEKIVNLPFSLPSTNLATSQKYKKDLFKKALKITFDDEAKKSVNLFVDRFGADMTFRQIKRLSNSINSTAYKLLVFKYEKLSVYLYDLLLLQYLQIISNSIYQVILNRDKRMFEELPPSGFSTINDNTTD
ncbi:MAG: P-loop NTPase fold protein, partial [Bacteroidales bacterium]